MPNEVKVMKDTKLPKPISNVIGNPASRRPLVLVLMILGALLAVQICVPFTTNSVAAASPTAIPAPTPDQEEIDALVEQLKGLLAETIEDEETVNSIVEKWEVRALARRTKKQIITALFADVKSVVRDKATQDAVWESWSDQIAEAEAEEPARPAPSRVKPKPTPEETDEEESEAPTSAPSRSSRSKTQAKPNPDEADAEESAPPSKGKVPANRRPADANDITEKGIDASDANGRWVLTDELKKSSGATEMAFFRSSYNSVKTWHSEPRQYKGYHYSISIPTDPIDPNAQGKMTGIDKAVRTVVDNGFALPYDLQFYCSPVDGVWTQAFKRGDNWAPVAYIFLGPGGSNKALSSTAAGFNGFDTRTIRTLHEIGHIIHERQAGDTYWQTGRTINSAASSQVSQYGCCNEKEFVAEVFAGMMIGKRWSNEVLAEYRKWHGPRPAIF